MAPLISIISFRSKTYIRSILLPRVEILSIPDAPSRFRPKSYYTIFTSFLSTRHHSTPHAILPLSYPLISGAQDLIGSCRYRKHSVSIASDLVRKGPLMYLTSYHGSLDHRASLEHSSLFQNVLLVRSRLHM